MRVPTIIDDLKRAVFRLDAPPLYGGPTLAEVVADVGVGDALYRLDDDGHCMWEIVLHAAYWRREVAHALSGGAVARLEEAGGRGPDDWPALPGIPGVCDEAHWQADRQLLDEAEAALLAALDGFDAQRWSEPVPPPPPPAPEDAPEDSSERAGSGGGWTLGQLVSGVMAHDAYHIGQAVMLKKAARLGLVPRFSEP